MGCSVLATLLTIRLENPQKNELVKRKRCKTRAAIFQHSVHDVTRRRFDQEAQRQADLTLGWCQLTLGSDRRRQSTDSRNLHGNGRKGDTVRVM